MSKDAGVKLKHCDLQNCESNCCYDGVYLWQGEEEKIREIVASDPDFFHGLPEEVVVDGYWDGEYEGRKTAIRPHEYQRKDVPEHFTRTRCVFCSPEHKCMLQLLAVKRGLHKWSYKPTSCWLFPLRIIDGEPAPPLASDEPDPNCLGEEFPGFANYTLCGLDREDGNPWEVSLFEEIEYWNKNKADLV